MQFITLTGNPHNLPLYSYVFRAAAYSQLNEQDSAIADSIKASEIDPSYAKAYSRLGYFAFLHSN
ncbi:Small glutamine-rich tetratricopeptide repeat-containing protein 2 [Entomophthora muscae]|uniref:Small glutamine-rich tetratricopeptide repeat-containing protein 2 n=1 Tax=Entomophthora muscae TaxID=34485 RepID=A0ACC2SAX3_9FUNG|nr:Small glutamine-rich tetratricopeptide repeat-containing protein 2 [Entomophthora muscae]